MQWIDFVWPMVSAASATLAGIHALIWLKQEGHRANLAFALAASSVAVTAILELLIMRTRDPAEYAILLRWAHVPVATLVLGLVAFVLLEMRCGSRVIATLAVLARFACLLPNFLVGSNLNFLELDSLHRLAVFGGGFVSVPGLDAVASPWIVLDLVADALLLMFVGSVVRDLHRRKSSAWRSNSLWLCHALIALVVFAQAWNWAVTHRYLHAPLMFSPVFLLVLLCMGYRLGAALVQANQLAAGLSLARRDLDQSRSRIRLAAAAGAVGLWTWDRKEGSAWFSRLGLRILGHRPGEVTGVELLEDRLDPAERERFDAMVAAACQGDKPLRGEFRLVLPEGVKRWIVMHGQAHGDPDSRRIEGAFADITWRKDAEEQFRALVESTPTAMLVFDLQGRITLANRRTASLFGRPVDELLDMNVEQILQWEVDSGTAAYPWTVDGSVELSAAIGSECELVGRHRSGSMVHVRMTLDPIPFGSDLKLMAVLADLSEESRLKRESAVQRDELAHLSRVATLSEMSGSLAHELNQPLTAILANAQAAVRFLDRDPPALDEVRDGLRNIIESDKRAGEVIRRLRSLLRKEPADYRYLDINELVQGVLRIISGDLLNRNISTSLDLADDPPLVCGDAVQLQQVLLNLIMNACDAMADRPDGVMTIRTALSSGAGARMVVSVSDCGRGIRQDDLDRIFTPFFTSKRDGLGLGLPVCQSIIDAHDGTLKAFNNADQGATVCFELPVRDDPQAAGPCELR